MSTQQDIYAAGSENRPPMLDKENYVQWSSRLLHYAKSRPNGKLIYNSIINGPYVRRMIPKPGDQNREVPINETFHEHIDDELTEKELKQVEADNQAIQTILLGLPEDIYVAVDSYETTQEIWLRVQQMMKGSDIGIQEKKAKLFNEWERFTSTDGESIESYYHCFLKLMNDFKRNKHFPEKIANYTQLYDFLKYNQKEVDELRSERLEKTHDPLALMANNPFNYPVFHQDQPSPNPTTAMNMELVLMAKAFKLNYSTPTNNNQRISSNPHNRQIAQPGMNMDQNRQMQMVEGNGGNQFRQYAGQNVGNQNGYNAVQNVRNQVVQYAVQNSRAQAEGNAIRNNGNQIRCYNYRGLGHLARNCTVKPRRRDVAYLQTQLLIAQKEEAGIQLQAKEFDLMAATADVDEIEEVNANCILMANLQQALTSGTQIDKAPVYDSDGSAEVHNYDNCYDNEIFNMFTQKEQYTELLEHIPEPHQVQHNDSNVISEVSSVEQDGGTVDQHLATVEETHAYFESLYNNLEIEVEKANSHDPPVVYDSEETLQLAQESHLKMKQLNKEIKPANYTKINHLSGVFVSQTAKSREELYFSNTSKTANVSKPISIPNEEFSDDTTPSVARKFLNEVKSTIVTLQRVVKQKMTLDIHNWSSSVHQEIHKIVKDEIFPIVNQVDARLQNFKIQFLKEAAKFVRDFKSLAKEADESLAKHKALELEIERLLRAVVSQDIMSIVQSNSVIDTSNLQTELDHMKERFENCIIKKENEYAKLWNDWYKKCEECKYDKISYDKAYNDMQQKIERLQAQLGDQKGKSKDTPCINDTIYENAKLRAQLFDKVSDQKDTNKGTSANTKFAKQSILGKPPSSSRPKLYAVTPLPNSTAFPKVGETNALSKPVTSNSVPSSRGGGGVESTIVNNERVIAPGIFRINPFKATRVDNFVPNKHVKTSVRTKPIIVSQPHVITKNDVNSKTNGFSPKDSRSTTRTRRPKPWNNPKSDKVPFKSKVWLPLE
ncbi:hypothetical protein Tco_0630184 [Tanacetum coccineum]